MWQTPDTTPLFCYLIIELRSQPFKDDRTLRSEIHPTTAIIGRSRLSMFCSPRRGEEKRRTISVASLTSHSTEIESFSPPFGAIWGRGSDGSRIVLRYRQKGERYSSSKEFVVPFNPISFFFLHFFSDFFDLFWMQIFFTKTTRPTRSSLWPPTLWMESWVALLIPPLIVPFVVFLEVP